MLETLEYNGVEIFDKDRFEEFYQNLYRMRDQEAFIEIVKNWILNSLAYIGDHPGEELDDDTYELLCYCFDEWDMRIDTYDTVHTDVDFYKGYYQGLFVYKINDNFYGVPFSDNGDRVEIELNETHPVYPRSKMITVWEDAPDTSDAIRW